MPSKDREGLIAALAWEEIATRIKRQNEFFSTVRPQQPVPGMENADSVIASNEAAASAVWNRHGWPKLRKAMPPVREIAEKQGSHLLVTMYDYLYRLTSAGVHFDVQSLLRSGWGPTLQQVVFSTKNFHSHFTNHCAIYGAFMFVVYFESFGAVLRPGPKERETIAEIRKSVLYTPRWPEMVTFEEMNLTPPSHGETGRMIMSALQAVSRKRLISKGVDYNDKRSAERRRMEKVFERLARHEAAGPRTPIRQNPSPIEGAAAKNPNVSDASNE